MKPSPLMGLLILILTALSLPHSALALAVGDTAPDFTLTDIRGTKHKLSEYRGRYVVLEWHNPECPFVKSQYNKGKMQTLQKKWTKKSVVWFRVNSSAPGKEGYLSELDASASARKQRTFASATFLDPEGKLGHKYDAKTTPHMFVINPKGKIIYNGAIDNAPLMDKFSQTNEKGEPFVNYVGQALKESMKGWAVTDPSTTPYGCSVKY